MNIKDELTCKQCKNIYNEPIFLYCCSDNICKEHLSSELSNSSLKKITCPFCSTDIDKHGLNVNKLIQKLVENELHNFKTDPKFKDLISDFRNEIQQVKKILNDPENFVYDKLSEIKRQVDLDRENCKTKIDDLANGVIEKLETFEKMFKNGGRMKINSIHFNDLINESEKQLEQNERFINLFSTDNSEREEKSIEVKKMIQNLELERNKLETEIFYDKSFKYKESSENVEDYFGKLIVSIYYKVMYKCNSAKLII